MTIGIPFPEIDPIALGLGPIHIRWYALAYLAGFIGGWMYGGYLVDRTPERRPNRTDLDDLLSWVVLGVILGGRLGYVLFYNLPYYLENPMQILAVWEGGMSFHGGVIGVMTVCVAFARKRGIPVLALGDVIACVVPIGLFFGRIANFINGELFGRVTTVPWAVIFPYGGGLPRHPSQLYEAILEGLVLFIILFVLAQKSFVRNRPGILLGVFCVGYGLSRFFIEFYREPDPQVGLILEYFSLGQFLCLPMIAAGVWSMRYGLRQK